MGMTCTEEEAEQWFKEDVYPVEVAINKWVLRPINQNQFDALMSFTFNEGAARLLASTLLRFINAGDLTAAALEFPKWNKIHKNGQLVVEPGLVTRRHNEQTLFNS
jgi:lysozyme